MNSVNDSTTAKAANTYVILGATGNTGSIISDFLLSKGKKVRVIGRDPERLQRFVRKGAVPFTTDITGSAALARAFSGAQAAYLMLPPITTREDQERQSDAIAKAARESGLRFAVHLSSFGGHAPEGTGPSVPPVPGAAGASAQPRWRPPHPSARSRRPGPAASYGGSSWPDQCL